MTENGWGETRKINGKPATPILVVGGEWKLKQKLRQMDGSLNYIYSQNLSVHRSARYWRRPGCKYPHLVPRLVLIRNFFLKPKRFSENIFMFFLTTEYFISFCYWATETTMTFISTYFREIPMPMSMPGVLILVHILVHIRVHNRVHVCDPVRFLPVSTFSMDTDVPHWHGHTDWTLTHSTDMDMQAGLRYWYAAWTWTCWMSVLYVHVQVSSSYCMSTPCCMSTPMLYLPVHAACSSHAACPRVCAVWAWTCSMDMDAAWIWTLKINAP